MTRFTLLSLGVLVYGALSAYPTGLRAVAALGAAVGLSNPVAGVGLAMVGFSLKRHRVLRERRLARQRAEDEIELLTHSMLIGLSGGLSAAAALLLSRETLQSRLRDEVDRVLRRSVQEGLAASLLSSRGVGGRLFRQIGAAQLSGAPLGLALTSLATEHRAAARARAVERARRLPVKMVLPITLLMLPGLLILMVGPLVLPSVARMLGRIVSL